MASSTRTRFTRLEQFSQMVGLGRNHDVPAAELQHAVNLGRIARCENRHDVAECPIRERPFTPRIGDDAGGAWVHLRDPASCCFRNVETDPGGFRMTFEQVRKVITSAGTDVENVPRSGHCGADRFSDPLVVAGVEKVGTRGKHFR